MTTATMAAAAAAAAKNEEARLGREALEWMEALSSVLGITVRLELGDV